MNRNEPIPTRTGKPRQPTAVPPRIGLTADWRARVASSRYLLTSRYPDDTASTGTRDLDGARLLVVDDEPLVREMLVQLLRLDGAETVGVDSGESALALLGRSTFDLVLLDMGLPGISGFETLRQIRERSDVPVIIVTAAGSLAERVAGFDLGADDYVIKPTEAPELARRARAVLRRYRGAQRNADDVVGPGGIILRLRAHEVWVGGEQVPLTPKEFAILRLLLERRGEVIAPDDLSLAVWGYETFGSRNFVEAHISRLRTKLTRAGAADVLTTIRGVGYVIR